MVYKALQEAGIPRGRYLCECGGAIYFFGEVLRLWCCPRARGRCRDADDWLEIPISAIENTG